MIVWFISDTHGTHEQLKVPEYDIVIHCGDEANSWDTSTNTTESLEFFEWFDHLPGEKIFIPGNHSMAVSKGLIKPRNTTILIDRKHKNIYGSPWTPTSHDSRWAYTKKRQDMKKIWDRIQPCEILATHGPPRGILDLAKDYKGTGLVHCGCTNLHKAILKVQPRIHAFGHIHTSSQSQNSGLYENWGIKFINCSVVDNNLTLINNGVLVDTSMLVSDFPPGNGPKPVNP